MRGWTREQTLSHTLPELVAFLRADRVARGEPEDGATCSDAEARRWLKKVKRGKG